MEKHIRSIRIVVSFVMIFSILFSFSSPAAAFSSHEEVFSTPLLLFSDISEFNDVFTSQSANTIVSLEVRSNSTATNEKSLPVGSVTYDYDINLLPSDVGTATIVFFLNIGGVNYPAVVSGQIHTERLSDEYSLIVGGLFGFLTIESVRYEVDAYLRKMASQDTINVGITLTPPDYNSNPSAKQILLSFGPSVMTEDVLVAYQEYISNQEVAMAEDITLSTGSTLSTSGLSYYSTAYGYTRDSGSSYNGTGGIGQRLVTYLDNNNKRYVAFLYSYSDRFNEQDFTSTFISANIYAYQIGIQRVGTNTSIASMEGQPEAPYGITTTNLWGYVYGLVSAIASYAGYGSITTLLAPIFQGTSGTITTYDAGNKSYVHVTFDTSKRVNFDDNAFPVGFNILLYPGQTGTYYTFSELTYLIDCLEAAFLIRTTQAQSSQINVSYS